MRPAARRLVLGNALGLLEPLLPAHRAWWATGNLFAAAQQWVVNRFLLDGPGQRSASACS